VLSLGKLAVGQADYYLEQAQGSVTRPGAVASGVEDYCLRGLEAPGTWVGSGTRALGLGGTVDALRLDRVLSGCAPASGEAFGRVVPRRVPGFDLTFSAPKSVSVLFGVGDDELRRAIQDAHDVAVGEALAYVEREAGVTRRGAGGAVAIAGRGLIGAAFRYRTSRAGDPQLHTHVLVANLVLGADGPWGTLDGRRIYAHAKTAGYLYEHRLRVLLTRALGFEWETVRNGIADVAGVSPEVRRAFSRRRVEIEAEMTRRGVTSAGGAQVAALATRTAKDYRVTPDGLVPEWQKRAAALGLYGSAMRDVVGRARARELVDGQVDSMLDWLGAADGVTKERSTFTRREVLQALASELPVGADVGVEALEEIADRFLGSDRVVVLADGERRGEVIGDDGRVVRGLADERRYSTPELLERERRVLDYADRPLGGRAGVGREGAVDRALMRRPTIAGEQAEIVRRLVLDGDGVAVAIGQAGTGKTFALAAAREAWEGSGYRVMGAALRAGPRSSSRTGLGSRARASRRCWRNCGLGLGGRCRDGRFC
jgi:conjugative relaxase-like TrwC/TraI family protein